MKRPALVALVSSLIACSAEAPPPVSRPLATAAPAPPIDVTPPAFRLPDSVVPVKVAARLSLRPAQHAFSGSADIDLDVKKPVHVLWLHARTLAVKEATLDVAGKKRPARVVPGGAEMLGFVFNDEVPSGPARLSVSYTGHISPTEDQGVFRSDQDGGSYVFTQFESTHARRAFPCFDEPGFKIPWQLTLEVDAADTAYSNTYAVAEEPLPGGRKAVQFRETSPLPSYLVAFATGPFETLDAGRAGRRGVPLRLVVPRGRKAEGAGAAAALGKVVNLVETNTGVPYPYDKLDVVVVPQLASFSAMENAALITVTARAVLVKPGEDTPLQKRDAVNLLAHEVAHQWFGDLVTLRFWDDTWLNEGFASWMDEKATTQFDPSWAVDLDAQSWFATVKAKDGLLSARKVRQEITTNDDIQNAFDGITYGKGAATLGMFEAWMGPDAFRKGIQLYLTRFAFKNATSADFLAALSEGSGKDVTAAFSTFLDQPGVPLVTAKLTCDAGTARVSLSQERFLPAGSGGSATASTWQIPLCVKYGTSKEIARTCTLLADKTADLPLPPLPGQEGTCPSWLMPNAAGTGYYYSSYSKDQITTLLGKDAPPLTPADRQAVVSDLGALAATGRYPLGDALDLLPALLRDSSGYVQMAAADIASGLTDDFVEPDLRKNAARFVSKVIVPRVRALGLQAKSDDPAQTRALRESLLDVLHALGDDPKLLAEAAALTAKWLKDPTAIEPGSVGMVLRMAASRGDRKLFDQLVTAAKAEKDARTLNEITLGLAGFTDPALVKASLDLVLDGTLDARAARRLLFRQQPSSRKVVWAYFEEHWQALIARLPEGMRPGLLHVPSGFCDEPRRAEVESFLKDRAPTITGAPRKLAQSLESISLCSARREANKDSLRAFLKRQ